MRILSYILRSDSGYAPNPFHGHCTLACCKPMIRRSAKVGDWIVGLSPRRLGNAITYAMQVSEVISFAVYFRDPRFAAKRPDPTSPDPAVRCGDNCYQPLADGTFRPLPSFHHEVRNADRHAEFLERDLGGRNVLVASRYCYFGADAVPLPPELAFLVVGRAHRCNFSADQVARTVAFLVKLPRGLRGLPRLWPEAADSAIRARRGCR